MANFNKVILIGNLTRDPEMKYTPKGTAVARLGLAINHRYTTETGETKEEVTFIDIDAWGKQAEVIAQYCRKGRPLMVEGRLKLHSWDDKQTGAKQSKLRVVLESFQFLGGREEGAPGSPGAPGGPPTIPPSGVVRPPARPPASRPANAAPSAAAPADPLDGPPPEEDDVPF